MTSARLWGKIFKEVNKMKTKKTELEVDFIGELGTLTSSEEKAISDFFRQQKSAKRFNAKKHFGKLKGGIDGVEYQVII